MSGWTLTPLGKTERKKKSERVWIVRTSDGSTTRHPVRPSSGGRMRPKGAGAKAKARQKQLERDLAKARRERVERASRGEFEPRSQTGERVERLDLEPSPAPVSKYAGDFEVPGARRRREERVERADEQRVSYRGILDQPTTVDGRLRKNDAGGDVLAGDVRPLL